MKRSRLLLADDHTLLLEAFKRLLEPEFEVVGTASDGRGLLAAAERLKPDAVILDIAMPLLNGLEAGRRLKAASPSVRLIYLSMNRDPDLITEAFSIGASAYLVKSSAVSELLEAIREAMRGRSYVTPLVASDMIQALIQGNGVRRKSLQLTPRQREVLQLLAEGRSMKEAANILDVTPRTIAFHKYRIMEDMNLKSSAELIQFAARQAIV